MDKSARGMSHVAASFAFSSTPSPIISVGLCRMTTMRMNLVILGAQANDGFFSDFYWEVISFC